MGKRHFELRERVSERERLYISSFYYLNITGEVDKAIETDELWKRMYPRDLRLYNEVAAEYHRIGQYERAIEAASEGVRLNPNSAQLYFNLGRPFIRLNRFEEARARMGKVALVSRRAIQYYSTRDKLIHVLGWVK